MTRTSPCFCRRCRPPGRLTGLHAARIRWLLLPIGVALLAGKLGGLPSLTAALVILTGITGAISGSVLCAVLRLRDPGVQGFAPGVASHGIDTARAFQLSEQSGAFARIGMGLNAVPTTALVPLAIALLVR